MAAALGLGGVLAGLEGDASARLVLTDEPLDDEGRIRRDGRGPVCGDAAAGSGQLVQRFAEQRGTKGAGSVERERDRVELARL